MALELDRPPPYSSLITWRWRLILKAVTLKVLCPSIFKRIKSLHLYCRIIIFRVHRPLLNVTDITAQKSNSNLLDQYVAYGPCARVFSTIIRLLNIICVRAERIDVPGLKTHTLGCQRPSHNPQLDLMCYALVLH